MEFCAEPFSTGITACPVGKSPTMYMVGVHMGGFKGLFEEHSVFADHPRMKCLYSGAAERDRLIETFAACVDSVGCGTQGFSRSDKMIDLINVIDIQRTEIQYLHNFNSPYLVE